MIKSPKVLTKAVSDQLQTKWKSLLRLQCGGLWEDGRARRGVKMRPGLRVMRGRQGRLWEEEETPFAPGALAWRSS